MCCGKSRNPLQIPTAGRTAPARSLSIGLSARPAPGRGPFVHAPRPPVAPGRAIAFEYGGRTALSVVSPLTGWNYRFDRPGARLAIDPRDQDYLRLVPNLRRVG